MTAPSISSGASGPAYASAQPRTDPIPAASAQGPSQMALAERWAAYCGDFVGPLKPLAGQPDLNVITNRAGPMVRQGVDFLFGPVLKLEHGEASAQDILDAVWGNEDRRMTTLSKARINGGVYGHVFVKIRTNPNSKTPHSADNPPRLVVQNPELYSVETDPDDCEEVTRYICTWQATDDDGEPCWHRQTTTRVDPDKGADENYTEGGLDYEGKDTTWAIQNWTKKAGTGTAEQNWKKDGPATVWPYPFAPIVDWQNYPNPNAHWGAADVDASYVNLNKQLHLIESNTNSVQYSHGHPWLFGIGTDTSGITPTPGTITDLPHDSNIVAISASGDVQHMMDFSAQIRADMDEASATPGVATGRVAELPKGAISGILVRLLYQARLARMEHERRLYGEGVREISRRVLIICGQETASDEDINLTWQDPLPQDDLAMAQMALTLQQLGVSDHSIYALIGLNYDTEQEYKKQEAADAMKAALQGGALPSMDAPGQPGQPAQPGAAPADPASEPGQAPQPGSNVPPAPRPAPPSNHPAAVAAQQGMKAVGAAVKANNKLAKGAK